MFTTDGIPISIRWKNSWDSSWIDTDAVCIPLRANTSIAIDCSSEAAAEIKALCVGDATVRDLYRSPRDDATYLCKNFGSYVAAPQARPMYVNTTTDNKCYVTIVNGEDGEVFHQDNVTAQEVNTNSKKSWIVTVKSTVDSLLILLHAGFKLARNGQHFLTAAWETASAISRIVQMQVVDGQTIFQVYTTLGALVPEVLRSLRAVYNSFREITNWPVGVAAIIPNINHLPELPDQQDVVVG